MSIEEGNKLIADFMGFEYNRSIPGHGGTVIMTLTISDCRYHSSWDWLMPVVEKMEKEGYAFTIDPWGIELIEYLSGREEVILYHQFDPDQKKIENWWYAVVEFIQWYNALPKI